MRARMASPLARAYSSETTTRAAPPSLSDEALPAVTVRSSLPPFAPGKAGRSLASVSAVVSFRGPSSVSTIVGPFFPGS